MQRGSTCNVFKLFVTNNVFKLSSRLEKLIKSNDHKTVKTYNDMDSLDENNYHDNKKS